MDKKLQKIIIREVIIAICVFVAVLINYFIPNEKPVCSYLGITGGKSYKVSFPTPINSNNTVKFNGDIFKAIVESYPETFNTKTDKDATELEAYPSDLDIKIIGWTNSFWGNLRNTLRDLVVLIVFVYAIYLLIRLIMGIKAYGVKNALAKTKYLLKKALEKDFLIKTALILGILFLLISILKSCGIYRTPARSSLEDDYERRLPHRRY